MTKKLPVPDAVLMDILEHGQDATPLDLLRRAYRAGQASALSDLGRKAGSCRSPAKLAAIAQNAKKGGRPKGAKDKHPRKQRSTK